jgi:hypothetical protein
MAWTHDECKDDRWPKKMLGVEIRGEEKARTSHKILESDADEAMEFRGPLGGD